MLGKTNITALEDGAIITEIEDFNWIRMQSGVYSTFVRTIYENGYLVAITVDGKVVYTTDGETWQVYKFEYVDCRLNDIAWDGEKERFLLAGSYKDTVNEKTVKVGLLVTTTDFAVFDKVLDVNAEDTNYYKEIHIIYPVNGKYIVIGDADTGTLLLCYGDLVREWDKKCTMESQSYGSSNYFNICDGELSFSKSSDRILLSVKLQLDVNSNSTSIFVFQVNTSTVSYEEIEKIAHYYTAFTFECKDKVYYSSYDSTTQSKYVLTEVTFLNEKRIIVQNANYAFVDGVYFDGSELFINDHKILIVKEGERITDKTLDDLVEITPENAMTCITKAFGQLFIFGKQGLIIKSSTKGNSGEAILVQTISAKKALLDAKAYTDQQYKLLEEKIARLEEKMAGEEA